jgi:predicted tellurium resistance membrane protein TerC
MLQLLLSGFNILLVDIDNTLFTADSVGKQKAEKRRRFLILLSLGEFLLRLVLLWVFGWLISGTEPLFYIGPLAVTPETISLFAAGTYLLVSSVRDLVKTFRGAEEEAKPEFEGSTLQQASIGVMVLALMSIDTILVILNMTKQVDMMIYLLVFSAVFRILFVQSIADIVTRNPGILLFVHFLLGIIGLELIIQGFGFDEEIIFNSLVLLALLIAIAYQMGARRKTG